MPPAPLMPARQTFLFPKDLFSFLLLQTTATGQVPTWLLEARKGRGLETRASAEQRERASPRRLVPRFRMIFWDHSF